MKKTLIIMMAVLGMSIVSLAQNNIVNKYFDKFATDENFTKVSVSSKMFSLFTELEAGSPEEEEFLKAVSKLKGLKMVVSDSTPKASTLFKEALNDVNKSGYEELMMVQDADKNLRFSIKESGGVITELLMVAGGKKEFAIISLFGEIDLKNISKIARTMNVSGLKDLEKLDGQGGN
jgi:hypothetical protein